MGVGLIRIETVWFRYKFRNDLENFGLVRNVFQSDTFARAWDANKESSFGQPDQFELSIRMNPVKRNQSDNSEKFNFIQIDWINRIHSDCKFGLILIDRIHLDYKFGLILNRPRIDSD